MGHVTESIFEDKWYIIPLADVVWIEKFYWEDHHHHEKKRCKVFIKNCDPRDPLQLWGEESVRFIAAWCSYRRKVDEQAPMGAENPHKLTGESKTIAANKVLNEIAVVVRRIERAGRNGVSGTAGRQGARALEFLAAIRNYVPDDVIVCLYPSLREAFRLADVVCGKEATGANPT